MYVCIYVRVRCRLTCNFVVWTAISWPFRRLAAYLTKIHCQAIEIVCSHTQPHIRKHLYISMHIYLPCIIKLRWFLQFSPLTTPSTKVTDLSDVSHRRVNALLSQMWALRSLIMWKWHKKAISAIKKCNSDSSINKNINKQNAMMRAYCVMCAKFCCRKRICGF